MNHLFCVNGRCPMLITCSALRGWHWRSTKGPPGYSSEVLVVRIQSIRWCRDSGGKTGRPRRKRQLLGSAIWSGFIKTPSHTFKSPGQMVLFKLSLVKCYWKKTQTVESIWNIYLSPPPQKENKRHIQWKKGNARPLAKTFRVAASSPCTFCIKLHKDGVVIEYLRHKNVFHCPSGEILRQEKR